MAKAKEAAKVAEKTLTASEVVDERGFATLVFGKDGTVEVKSDGDVVFKLSDVQHPFPVTREALDFAYAGYSYEVVDAYDVTHTLKGVEAAAAAKFMHSMESLRGAIRTDADKGRLRSADYYRQTFASFRQVGGGERRGGRRPVMTKAEVDAMDLETLKARLYALGVAE